MIIILYEKLGEQIRSFFFFNLRHSAFRSPITDRQPSRTPASVDCCTLAALLLPRYPDKVRWTLGLGSRTDTSMPS
ncbi:hypothetical protein VTK73DRAFT_10088 [Phialemonium thermophilum]|uniref:Uncharacterized protein n=1 Tax=Phialemonium thermophilum TaxID=223376 RepID=A0ABR3VYP1_9PEZI